MTTLRRKYRWTTTVILMLLIVGVSFVVSWQAAKAYNLFGGIWPNQPSSGCCLTLKVKESSYYSIHHQAWNDGTAAWNMSSANVLYSYTSGNDWDIHLSDVNDSGVSWDGYMDMDPCTSCTYSFAHGYLNYHYTYDNSAAMTKSIAVHELGHANGLAHESGCVVMQATTSVRWGTCGINYPTQDDINGVNAQY